MVDDRALRFRRRTPVGEPPGQTRTDSGEPGLGDVVSNVWNLLQSRSSAVPSSTLMPYGSTSATGTLKTFAMPGTTVSDAAKESYDLSPTGEGVADVLGLAGDLAIPVGFGIGGAKAGVRAATDPTNQARINAMFGRLYHGNKDEPWSVAQNRPLFDPDTGRPLRAGNWFNFDIFSTPSLKLADSYGPAYRLGNLPRDLKVLDLMPGGRTVAEQSPRLAEALGRIATGNFDDVASMERHKALTSLPDDQFAKLMQEHGFNAVRHVSGQGAGRGSGLERPVYAFLNPAGITANPVGPVNRALYEAGEAIVNTPSVVREGAERVGSRFADSIQEAMRRSDFLGPRSQQFLDERGKVVSNITPSGVNRGDTRLIVDPATGRTIDVPYQPYPAVTGVVNALGRPAQAVQRAQQASRNAYQRALERYAGLEKANRDAFMQTYSNTTGLPYGGNLPGAPMPPGYAPLPKPAEPGAMDFLRYLFSQ